MPTDAREGDGRDTRCRVAHVDANECVVCVRQLAGGEGIRGVVVRLTAEPWMKAAEGVTEFVPAVPVSVGTVVVPAPVVRCGWSRGDGGRIGCSGNARVGAAHEATAVRDDAVVVRLLITAAGHVQGADRSHLRVRLAR
jgi:hypothetical protein